MFLLLFVLGLVFFVWFFFWGGSVNRINPYWSNDQAGLTVNGNEKNCYSLPRTVISPSNIFTKSKVVYYVII